MNLRALTMGGALGLAGCGPAPQAVDERPPAAADAGAPDAGARTARQLLEGAPARVVVVPFDTRGSVQGQALLTGAPASSIALAATGGAVSLALGPGGPGGEEQLSVERAEVALADVVLSPEELPPTGLHLTHLSARLQAPVRAPVRWYGEVEGLADLQGDLLLSGDILADDGSASPFDPQLARGVALQADLSTDAWGDLVVRFTADRAGPLWTWQGLYQTRDLHLAGRALDASAAAGAP